MDYKSQRSKEYFSMFFGQYENKDDENKNKKLSDQEILDNIKRKIKNVKKDQENLEVFHQTTCQGKLLNRCKSVHSQYFGFMTQKQKIFLNFEKNIKLQTIKQSIRKKIESVKKQLNIFQIMNDVKPEKKKCVMRKSNLQLTQIMVKLITHSNQPKSILKDNKKQQFKIIQHLKPIDKDYQKIQIQHAPSSKLNQPQSARFDKDQNKNQIILQNKFDQENLYNSQQFRVRITKNMSNSRYFSSTDRFHNQKIINHTNNKFKQIYNNNQKKGIIMSYNEILSKNKCGNLLKNGQKNVLTTKNIAQIKS